MAERERYLRAELAFAALYASPKARLASAGDLIAAMDEAGVDVSIALGFAWREAATCRRHNDYLLEAAARSGGRIVAFCGLPLAAGVEAIEAEARRCAAAGARGFGELRPEDLGFDLAGPAGARLAALARELDAALLFHASEPVGHAYPGKRGLAIETLGAFLTGNPGTRVIAAHWGGGLPFYVLMPEVRAALGDAYFDTAASRFLYEPAVYGRVIELVGAERVLFGSDFPLVSPKKARAEAEAAIGDAGALGLVLGGNAGRLLGLA